MASVARVTRPAPPPSIVSPSSPAAVIRVWPGATKASSWISARPFRRPARSTKFDNSSCANPMLASDRSRSIGSATGGNPQRAMRALNSCPLAERMKLSMSSRLPSSLSARARLVEAHRAAAGKPQAGAALPRLEREQFELDRAAGGLERGLDRDRNREAGCGDLRRRPEEDLGVAGDAGRAGAALACRKRDPGVDLEARVDVAAAGELRQDGPIGGKLAGRQTEGHARRHAVDAPGSGEGLAFDAHVLGEDLVGAPGRRRHRGHEKLPDAQVLEGPVAPEQLAGGKIGRQAPGAVGAGRDADLGAAEAGLGEAHLAAQERRQGDLGPNHGRGKRGRVRPAGAEPQLIDADPRPGQEPHLDPALGLGRSAGGLCERPLEGLPIRFPRHQRRRHERRREQDDQDTRDNRQDVAQRVRLPSRPVNSPPNAGSAWRENGLPGTPRLRTRRSSPGS